MVLTQNGFNVFGWHRGGTVATVQRRSGAAATASSSDKGVSDGIAVANTSSAAAQRWRGAATRFCSGHCVGGGAVCPSDAKNTRRRREILDDK